MYAKKEASKVKGARSGGAVLKNRRGVYAVRTSKATNFGLAFVEGVAVPKKKEDVTIGGGRMLLFEDIRTGGSRCRETRRASARGGSEMK